MQDYSDKDLVAGCLMGKASFEEALYKKYASKMFGVALRYTYDRTEAEDILQDAFIEILKSLKNFAFKGSLEGWIRRIVVFTAVHHFRKKDKRFDTTLSTDDLHEHFADSTSVLAQISAKEILNMIQQLPDGYRIVFNLHAIEGYSHAEIAEALNINESTSRSQLSKARNYLKNLLLKAEQQNVSINYKRI
jgi:RNA polymerase sigma-70 factor (ECF subfamily)